MMSLDQILNFIEISPVLGTAGQPKRNQFVDIAAAGYQCVINLATSSSENAIADESDLVTELGMEYIHIPVVWKAPQRADFDLFCTTMERSEGTPGVCALRAEYAGLSICISVARAQAGRQS
jgi:protein tyrosine phosphatase (PTP) superfamily phosphohydrolase (DUF442 family)